MSLEESPVPEVPAITKGPSELLSEARQRLGLSQKEVADNLFLTTSLIKSIDDGEYSRVKPAFLKGYLRSYARIVELSGDDMVALYDAELQAAEPAPEIRGVTEEKVGTASITGPVLQTGLIGLGGLALVIVFIWWLVSDSDEETQIRVTQPAVSPTTGPEVEEADFDFVLPPQGETAAESELAVLESTEAGPTDGELESEEAGGSPVTSGGAEERGELSGSVIAVRRQGSEAEVADGVKFERTTDGTRSFITVDASGFDQLEISFQDECWVEINDTQFGLIYNDLNRARDVLTIYGTAPFRVLLGKATGVEMIYNGRPFELEPFISKDRTAKLTVSD